jgi:hypothetical protein
MKLFSIGDEVECRIGTHAGVTDSRWHVGTVEGVGLADYAIRLKKTDWLVVHRLRSPHIRRVRVRKLVQEHRAPDRGPARSEKYLAFIRAMPCAGCANPGPSDPHHYGSRGVGQKASDFSVVPLCRKCHDHFHDHAELPNRNVEETRGDLHGAQAKALMRWITVGA